MKVDPKILTEAITEAIEEEDGITARMLKALRDKVATNVSTPASSEERRRKSLSDIDDLIGKGKQQSSKAPEQGKTKENNSELEVDDSDIISSEDDIDDAERARRKAIDNVFAVLGTVSDQAGIDRNIENLHSRLLKGLNFSVDKLFQGAKEKFKTQDNKVLTARIEKEVLNNIESDFKPAVGKAIKDLLSPESYYALREWIRQEAGKLLTEGTSDSQQGYQQLKELVDQFYPYAKSKLGFQEDPKVHYDTDSQNASKALGKTAYYEPASKSIHLFTTDRHPKDVLRSFAHELVHHSQACEGKLENNDSYNEGYAQEDDHLRKMEKEAYLRGNLLVRDWEDGLKKAKGAAMQNVNESMISESPKKMDPKKLEKIITKKEIREHQQGKQKRLGDGLMEKWGYTPKKGGDEE
jgi:hypothetical protein